MKGFEKIVDCRIETIQDSTFLDALSKDQERTFFYCLSYISENLKRPFGKSITLTYRGENFNNLASKLMSIPGTISEDKLVSLLFYFGDKAKHFYEIDDVAAQIVFR